jgi:hypothetical protein
MSLDYDESYHGSNSRPSFTKTAIVVTTFMPMGYVEVYEDPT